MIDQFFVWFRDPRYWYLKVGPLVVVWWSHHVCVGGKLLAPWRSIDILWDGKPVN